MQKQRTHTHTHTRVHTERGRENPDPPKTQAFEILCEVSNAVLFVSAHLNQTKNNKVEISCKFIRPRPVSQLLFMSVNPEMKSALRLALTDVNPAL